MQESRFWAYSPKVNKYVPVSDEPLSLFPTIVNMKNKTAYCRKCHQWEKIIAFKQNILFTQCGMHYTGPFTPENIIFNYGYDLVKKDTSYFVHVKGQTVVTKNRRLLESYYELDLGKKVLYKDGQSVFEHEDLRAALCSEITQVILSDMGERYKKQFGIIPTVASSLKGFNLIIGYMLSPFNINFYKIAQHWGLNPYDKDFASLSSGNTPTAENEMFQSLGIKATKSVRKLYQKFPQGIVCYTVASDLGFTDVNILQRAATPACYAFFKYCMISFEGGEIYYPIRMSLKMFVTDMLALTNQKTVWNSLERTFNYLSDTNIRNNVIIDGINSYPMIREDLTEKEKKDVLKEGFNQYTHDFLVRRVNANRQARRLNMVETETSVEDNKPFEIEEKFLQLEYKTGDDRITVKNGEGIIKTIKVEDDDRYCFYVARTPQKLKVIGSEMSNCVGWGYEKSVRDRHCTIVYAKYKKKYRICIEVTPQFSIRQSLGPHNTQLQGADLEAYHEWCMAKNIVFRKAFECHMAR